MHFEVSLVPVKKSWVAINTNYKREFIKEYSVVIIYFCGWGMVNQNN